MQEARVDRLELSLARLAEAQARTEEQLTTLGWRVDQLAEAQRRTEQRVEELAEALRQLTERVDVVVVRLDGLTATTNSLKGWRLEANYRDRALAYFGQMLRRIRVLSSQDLADLLEDAEDQGSIGSSERRDLVLTNVVVRGRRRESGETTYLAVEVSATIDEHDVWRALRRAEALGRAVQTPVVPVVAGERITRDAEELSHDKGVRRVLDGRASDPEETTAPVE
ncbi:MAG: hypothetical protein HY332_11530 [Chloroflexi bacterium]|nr:hypothetical protein [Chloroflexota bacterium]